MSTAESKDPTLSSLATAAATALRARATDPTAPIWAPLTALAADDPRLETWHARRALGQLEEFRREPSSADLLKWAEVWELWAAKGAPVVRWEDSWV